MQVFGEWAQVEVIELVNDGSGLAFGIVGGRSSGVVIKSVLPGGVADRDGRLHTGDMLLRIGGVCVVGMCARQAAAVLRQCGVCVRLLVARPHLQIYNQSEGPSSSPVVPSRLLADPVELERRLAEAGHIGFAALADTGLGGFATLADDALDDPPPVIIEERLHHRPVASIVAVVPRGALTPAPRPPLPPPVAEHKPPPLRLPLDMAVRGTPETESYSVELNKHSALGLGITVAGYVCEQQELSGIFVKSVSEGSAADLSGLIQVNDRIIEVDGVSLHGVSNHRAVALLRDAKGPVVRLKALRYLRGAGFERLQRALAAQDGRPLVAPPSPSVTSLAKYSFSVYDESTVIEAEPESEVRHVPSPTSPSEEREIVIGGQHEREQDSRRIQDKWRDILRNEPDWPGHQYQHDIIVGIIIKDSESGLGISLEGTVRVVRGRELQARHYIRAIAPGGPTDRTQLFKVGDELLEVNNWRVLGAHHVEVVSRLRAATSPVTLVAARLPHKKTLLNGTGVGGSLQALSATRGLRGSRGGLVKAKSETSLCSTHTHNNTVTSSNQDNSELCSWALSRSRSRSLEPLSGLAMWSDTVEYISLVKEDRGLGFSILDYLDPMEAGASVVVVRSVVRGGAAAREGRLAPGDRLVSVNKQHVARAPLHVAVNALKSAPKGIVTLGISKPLPCSTVVGGQKPNGHSIHSSQECINSLASDDNTGLDSFHECLQEYGEGLEVVQICLEPEDGSIKDEELSALGDLSTDSNKKEPVTNVEDKVNGLEELKSEASLDDQDDDMTITEDDILVTPRDLPDRSKSSDRKDNSQDRTLSKQQSKDISTSDEMVFAVTPTGLERITFDKYWKENDLKPNDKPRLEKVKSDESWKECLNSPADENIGYYDEATKISVQEENCSLLYIDHEVDGYETCLDDDSSSTKCTNSDARKPNGERDIKAERKHHKLALRNNDNDVSAKHDQRYTANSQEDFSNFGRPYVQEHIIKQMQSLKIEPINVNICNKKRKSPTKPSKSIRCVEYYNDQAECLEEIRQKKIELEGHHATTTDTKNPTSETQKKKLQIKNRDTSEESTDLDTFVPGCHKCFLEKYAYEITKAYTDEAKNCKYCEVIREMLVVERGSSRRRSAPALAGRGSGRRGGAGEAGGVAGGSGGSTSDDDVLLTAPGRERDRRKSAGPLKFIASSPKSSSRRGTMTVSSPHATRREGLQRWGPARDVCLRRKPGGPLGVSIVGGKVDIVSKEDGEGDEKAIFGIFIKNVVPDSPAANSGELHAGDRILEVEGVCVRSAPHERAVQLIQRAGDTVTLTVQTLLAWNIDSSDVDASPPPRSAKAARRSPAPPAAAAAVVDGTPQHEIKIMVTSEPEEKEDEREKENGDERDKGDAAGDRGEVEKKTVYSDSDSSDEEDERELQGRTYSENGVEIDRASAGAVKRSKEEKEADKEEEDDYGYTTNKIRKKYSSLGDGVVVVKLERSARAGLGLALAGHRDRSRMAVFICGLHPAGSAAKANPAVKVGDEILEVNGVVLHGRCHLNASAIIKGLVGPVFKIILLRRKTALEDVAVKPLSHTQFPVELDDQVSKEDSYKPATFLRTIWRRRSLNFTKKKADDRFANYKGVRDITVKKGPSGLGIMIIEGRHTEAGRGIFVSDLQEGSAAEQAGLQIGDMILAVNRDSLLSCSYDSAAAKLKQTEGVVVLTVCSPNLKEDGDSATAPATAAASRTQTPDARPTTPRPAPSPARSEPPPEPSVAPVVANQETVIEVSANSEPLGIVLLGGSDTQVNGAAAVILDIYKQGAIGKDGRLRVGDQILECNGIKITKEMAHERLCMSIKQKAAKLRMTVFRPDPVQYTELEVELARKPGRVLGLVCVTPATNTHLYLGDMLSGSVAECDGRLARGDLLVSAAGQELAPTADASADAAADTTAAGADASVAAAAALRLASGKTTLKVKRYKILR